MKVERRGFDAFIDQIVASADQRAAEAQTSLL